MKKILSSLLAVFLSFSLFAADDPTGSWEAFVKGSDPGLYRITFFENNTVTGYGISRIDADSNTFEGTWAESEDGKTIIVTLPPEDLDDDGTTLVLKVKAGQKISGQVISSEGTAPISGKPAPLLVYSFGGDWDVTIREGNEQSTDFLRVTASETFPGVFDFVTDSEISGQFLLAANGQYFAAGGEGEDAFAIVGKINFRKGTFNGTIFNIDGTTAKITGVRAIR